MSRPIRILVLAFAAILFPAVALADIRPENRGWILILGVAAFSVAALGALWAARRPMAPPTLQSPYRIAATPERRSTPIARKPARALSLALVAILGVFAAADTGCTPAQNAAAQADINAIVAAAGSPEVCAALTAIDGSEAGSVCGTVQTAVGQVAALVEGILKSLPATAKVAVAAVTSQPIRWLVTGTTVTLRADLAPLVQSAAIANTKAAKAGAK